MRPAAGVAVAVLAGLAAAALLAGLGGVAVFWSALLGLPVAAFVALLVLTPRGAEPEWRPLPEPPSGATEHQAGLLTARLTEAATDSWRFHSRLQPRLRRLAVAAVRRRHPEVTTVDDPRAVVALGPELHRLLTATAGATLPDPTRTAELLARLEEL